MTFVIPRVYSRFIKGRFCIFRGVENTYRIRAAYRGLLRKKNRTAAGQAAESVSHGCFPNARYRRLVKAPIADYHVPVAAQESHQFFFPPLSRDLACVNGCAFYSGHVRNSRVLRSLTTDLARGD